MNSLLAMITVLGIGILVICLYVFILSIVSLFITCSLEELRTRPKMKIKLKMLLRSLLKALGNVLRFYIKVFGKMLTGLFNLVLSVVPVLKTLTVSVMFLSLLTYAHFQSSPVTITLPVMQFDTKSAGYYAGVTLLLRHLVDHDDTVIFNIKSPGGMVKIGLPLVNAILETEAHTVCVNKLEAASMAGLVSMACDELQASTISYFLFHRPYRVVLTPAGLQKQHPPLSHPVNRVMQHFLDTHVFPYLTDEEILRYYQKYDIIITGPEFMKRVKKVRGVS